MERLSWISTIAGTVLVAIATVAAVLELRHVQSLIREITQGNRISATLNYNARYKSDPLVGYARQLRAVWFSDDGRKTWNKSAQERADFVENQGIEDAVLGIADFYDDLYLCIDNDLCDSNLTLLLLSRDIEAFYVLSHPYLEQYERKMQSRLGCGIDALIKPAQSHLLAIKNGTLANGSPEVLIPRGACWDL